MPRKACSTSLAPVANYAYGWALVTSAAVRKAPSRRSTGPIQFSFCGVKRMPPSEANQCQKSGKSEAAGLTLSRYMQVFVDEKSGVLECDDSIGRQPMLALLCCPRELILEDFVFCASHTPVAPDTKCGIRY